jgi:hypothetical protein
MWEDVIMQSWARRRWPAVAVAAAVLAVGALVVSVAAGAFDDDDGDVTLDPTTASEQPVATTAASSPATSAGASSSAPASAPGDSGAGGTGGTGTALRFEHTVIDEDPPSGDACCLDVMTTGDVDADGLVDVVIGAEHADGLSWYRNPGGESGSAWERFPIGEGDFTTDGQAADVDDDGDLDVVISSIDRSQIEWWEQTGDPTSADGWARHDIGDDYAHDLIVADLDGNGRLDVAAMHFDAGRIAWYQAPDVATDEWTTHDIEDLAAEGIAAGDLDADGDLDLVAGPAVYLNDDGSGASWSATPLADDWSNQARPAIGDIDGDGALDIVLSHDETDGRLSWFRGPDWTEQPIEADAGFSHSLELGDADLDGDLDLMVGVMHANGSRLVRVLVGDGGSTWTPLVLGESGTHNAAFVDLDGDGRLDVVGKNYDGPKQVEVWWNRAEGATAAEPPVEGAFDQFRYVQVDDARDTFNDSMPYFGLAFGDLDADADVDIASGGYVYLNPGGDMSATWERVDLTEQIGESVDAMLVADVDGDADADVIATALPDVWWLESSDGGRTWSGTVVAEVPATPRPNGQGYRLGDLTGDGVDEIVLSGGNNESDVWYLEIPADPDTGEWPAVRVTETATDEQVGIGDIDGDGDNDVAAGDMRDGGEFIAWFENPGDGSSDWERHRLGSFDGVYPDRLDVADLDGDGALDVVVTEENDGAEPNAEVMWYRQPDDPFSSDWPRHVVVAQYSTNGLDVADGDGDGDLDLVTGEHRGTRRVAVWENVGATPDGDVTWQEHLVDEGKESHLGARVADLDGDGDLEIVSIGFDEPELLHLWVNDAG